jgi:hypothetical protein
VLLIIKIQLIHSQYSMENYYQQEDSDLDVTGSEFSGESDQGEQQQQEEQQEPPNSPTLRAFSSLWRSRHRRPRSPSACPTRRCSAIRAFS